MKGGACAGLVGVLLAMTACSEPPRARPRVSFTDQLAGHEVVVARVGALEITSSMIAGVSRARGLSAREALNALADDAVAANVALKRDIATSDDVRRNLDAALARQTLRRILDEARAKGPLTDAELAELSERHWKQVDLPERVRVVHAVILRKPEKRELMAKAPAVAKALRDAVVNASSADDFEKKAKAFPKDGYEIVVQPLPTFDGQGRITDAEEGAMDRAFAEAAIKLAPDATSDVVESSFGWHVIRGVEHEPPLRLPTDQRRELFAEEGMAMRARRLYDAVIEAQRARHAPSVETYAEQGLATIVIASPSAPEATR